MGDWKILPGLKTSYFYSCCDFVRFLVEILEILVCLKPKNSPFLELSKKKMLESSVKKFPNDFFLRLIFSNSFKVSLKTKIISQLHVIFRDGGKSCFSQSPVSGLSLVSRVKKRTFPDPSFNDFYKLSAEKRIFKIGRYLTELEANTSLESVQVMCKSAQVICKSLKHLQWKSQNLDKFNKMNNVKVTRECLEYWILGSCLGPDFGFKSPDFNFHGKSGLFWTRPNPDSIPTLHERKGIPLLCTWRLQGTK